MAALCPDMRKGRPVGECVLRARLEFVARTKPPRSVPQSEIAGVLGVADSTVGLWEAGRKIPDLGTIQRLAFALGVTAACSPSGRSLCETRPNDWLCGADRPAYGSAVDAAAAFRRRNHDQGSTR